MLTVAIALGVVVGLLRGGRLTTLGAVPWRWLWLAPVAFALQVLAVYGVGASGLKEVGALLHVSSYIPLGVVLWANRSLPGAKAIALGLLLNFVVIAANGGYMPVSREALAAQGQSHLANLPSGTVIAGSKDILLDAADTRLWFLSDVITNTWLPLWERSFSLGDVVLAAGVFYLVQAAVSSPIHRQGRLTNRELTDVA